MLLLSGTGRNGNWRVIWLAQRLITSQGQKWNRNQTYWAPNSMFLSLHHQPLKERGFIKSLPLPPHLFLLILRLHLRTNGKWGLAWWFINPLLLSELPVPFLVTGCTHSPNLPTFFHMSKVDLLFKTIEFPFLLVCPNQHNSQELNTPLNHCHMCHLF